MIHRWEDAIFLATPRPPSAKVKWSSMCPASAMFPEPSVAWTRARPEPTIREHPSSDVAGLVGAVGRGNGSNRLCEDAPCLEFPWKLWAAQPISLTQDEEERKAHHGS